MPPVMEDRANSEVPEQETGTSRQTRLTSTATFPENLSSRPLLTAPVSQDMASRLGSLLDDAAMDLTQISDAIRACPEFEKLVLRRSNSLNLSIDTSIVRVEEAAVILGKDRLKILLETWSCRNGARPATGSELVAAKEKYVMPGHSIPGNLVQDGDVSQEELATLLFRDFASLMSTLGPRWLRLTQQIARSEDSAILQELHR